MTLLRSARPAAPLLGFTALLAVPGLAIQGGALPFEYRLHAMLAISALCIGLCLWAGFSLAELGFGAGEASALVRNGERTLDPPPSTRLEAGDTIVLRGPGDAVARGRDRLAGN